MRRPRGWRAGVALLGTLALALAAGRFWQQREAAQQQARGAALYHGERHVVATLYGHAQPLPALATRCANCHEAAAGAAPAGSLAAVQQPFAGRLTGAALATPRPRRGGPPSAYDAPRLCALLRTGIDPAQVMIPATMPRYDLTAADCDDLWAYLSHAPS